MKSFFLWLLLTPLTIVVLVAITLIVTEWHPAQQEVTTYPPQPSTTLPDSLTIATWNIGYAGLGDDMDFFYEGGTQTRTTEHRTKQNLEEIIKWLKSVDGVDFILLQEVDRNSRRSYHIDQYRRIAEALPHYHIAWAHNYISPFVPIPINNPTGRVEAGLMTLSKYPISRSTRYQYPSIPELPNRLFDLKRCMLTCEITQPSGEKLYINNTHNSAFSTTKCRNAEMAYIYNIVSAQKQSITAGDWNATPPHYTPSSEALSDPHFRPLSLRDKNIPSNHTLACDLATPSMRYLNIAYNAKKSTHCIVDFFIVNNYFKISDCQTINLKFKNSDHNPSLLIVKKATSRTIID